MHTFLMEIPTASSKMWTWVTSVSVSYDDNHYTTSNSIYIYLYIVLMSRVFVNGPGDRVSIPGRIIPKTHKIVFDNALLNTQHF